MSSSDSGERYVIRAIRAIRAEEWQAVKATRLLALKDALAHLAFVETYDDAAARPDSFWQERAAGAAEGSADARQIIAEDPDGEWVGTITVLVEEAGTTDWAGLPVEQRQGQVVGVYVRPEHRGTGLAQALFAAALDWAAKTGLARVRLLVHEGNGRAHGLYRKAGFVPSGVTVPVAGGSGEQELEYVATLGS